jgi:hypothetical protein
MTFWAAGAAIVGTVGSAIIGSKSVSKASDQQAASTDKALAANKAQADQTRADYAPWRAAGETALGQFAKENDTPLDQSKIQMDPGYQFGLTQGQQAIDRKTAAAGGRISGAALKEAAQYGTDYATTGYSTAYNRQNSARNDRLERLRALAGLGATSTSAAAAAGAASTSAGNALTIAAGNNQGAGTVAQGNIWGNTANQLTALYGRSNSSPLSTAAINAPYGSSSYNTTGAQDYYGTGYSP